MPGRQFVADDPIKDEVADIDLVVKTSGGVLVRAVNRRFGFNQILVEGAAELRMGYGPVIKSIYFFDASLTGAARWNDLINRGNGEKALIDRNTSATTGVALYPGSALDTGAALNSWATADFLYIRFASPAGGVCIDMVTTNSTASVVAGSYSTSSGFTALVTLVDNTISGGAMLGTSAATATVTGEAITWAPQQNWVKRNLQQLLGDSDAPNEEGYWVRLAAGTALDSTVSLTQIVALAPQAASATSIRRGRRKATTEYVITLDDEVGGLEFMAVAGADTTIDISWIKTRQTQ